MLLYKNFFYRKPESFTIEVDGFFMAFVALLSKFVKIAIRKTGRRGNKWGNFLCMVTCCTRGKRGLSCKQGES